MKTLEQGIETELFTKKELLHFTWIMAQMQLALVSVLALGLFSLVQAILIVVVLTLEYELIYRLFVGISGTDHAYWSPSLMALTGGIMVIGYHLKAKVQPNHPVVRFVEAVSLWVIAAYLLGIGLLVAALIGLDIPGDFLGAGSGSSLFGDSDTSLTDKLMPGYWIDWILTNVSNPVAIAAFSLGIGGLAVVNISVAHQLISRLVANLSTSRQCVVLARQARNLFRTVKASHKQFRSLGLELTNLAHLQPLYLAQMTANAAVEAMQEGLRPLKLWLRDHKGKNQSRFELPTEYRDPKDIEAFVERVSAITNEDIIDTLKPTLLINGGKL